MGKKRKELPRGFNRVIHSFCKKTLGYGGRLNTSIFTIAAQALTASGKVKEGSDRYFVISHFEYMKEAVGIIPRRKKEPRFVYIPKPPPRYINPNTDAFLESYEWRRVRMEALKRDGARCQCCGATPQDGLRMHVDHIKPRKMFPTLALDLDNLQVLCEICNHGKGNWDTTDWRSDPDADQEMQRRHLRDIMGEE